MTTAVYSYWAGAKVATGATDDAAWVIVIVLLVLISELIGWAVSVAMRRRLKKGDQGLPLLSPGAWGKPDLAPPSTSPEALAEVAELEALWRQPVGRRRRPASSD
jgi:hypothetical protein